MSLPDKAIWDRYATLNIEGRFFAAPPFSIEFEQTLEIGKPTQTKAKFYNPAPGTIKKVEPKITGKIKTYTEAIIEAGYSGNYGTAVIGQIHDYEVEQDGCDVILNMTIGDITEEFNNRLICKPWKNVKASTILKDIMSSHTTIKSKINLGTDINYRTFVTRNFKEALKKITADTKSQFYFSNGILIIEPKTAVNKKEVMYISPESGLIGRIAKNKDGYKFKTLFFYQIQLGDIVMIKDSKTEKTAVKIAKGKKSFSSFGDADCEWEAVAV